MQSTTTSRKPTCRIELYLSCEQLKDKDLFGKSDPFAVVSQKCHLTNEFVKIGTTETLSNNLNPVFNKQFVVDYYFHELQPFRVEIYDQDGDTQQTANKNDLIGACEFTLAQVMASCGQSVKMELTTEKKLFKSGKNRGMLLVRAEEIRDTDDVLQVQFAAKNLTDLDGLFNKSDPMLSICRAREDGSWLEVWKSETVRNNLNPVWKPIGISVQTLCNGDYQRPLLFQVMDVDSGGPPQIIGSVTSNLMTLMEKRASGLPLVNAEELKRRGKMYTNSGILEAPQLELIQKHTFIEYLRGGLEINLIVGIDYTLSNGAPSDPRSLHYLEGPLPNQYQQAIHAAASILQDYDHDKKIPVYGFGGSVGGEVSHCFPLTMDFDKPEVGGVDGIQKYYAKSLETVALSGPTLFGPLIQQACQISRKPSSHDKQKYYVLLIITDGVISDMQQTIDELVNASSSAPLSIVIVGVGSEDFSAMSVLDGDKNALKSSDGRTCARDIVHFVPYKGYSSSPARFATELLGEIPHQVVEYMKAKNLKPKPGLAAAFKTMTVSSTPAGAAAPPLGA